MKLYTEEQVKVMLGKARLHNMDDAEMFTDDYLIEKQVPLELPSDEEIEEIIKPFEFEYTKIGFRACAEWIKNKIQGGNK